MKMIMAFFVSSLVGTSSCFAFDISQPDTNVGTNWTLELADSYTGLVKSTWKNVVEQKTDKDYGITRYSDTGSVMFKYKVTRNLGQGSPTRLGTIGNGDLYKFPLTPGKTWTYLNHWVTGKGESGYDEITYLVVGQEALTTKAGTFDVIKVKGTGKWYNESSKSGEGIEMLLYYSPQLQNTIRSDRVQQMPLISRIPPTRERIDAVAYELK